MVEGNQAKEPVAEQPLAVERGEASPAQIEEIKTGKYFTIKQVAERFSYSVAWITYLVQEGRIKGIKPLGGRWRIAASEVERLEKEGIPPLPRQKPAPTAGEITVEGKHLERVEAKEKTEEEKQKEKKERGVAWPLNLFLGE